MIAQTNYVIEFVALVTCISFLAYFSYKDLKTREVDNENIFIFFDVAMFFLLFSNVVIGLFLTMITFAFCYFLWKKKVIGGADLKIIPCLISFIIIGIPNYFMGFWFFIVIFGIVGSFYGTILKLVYPKKKFIPFIPAILLTFILYKVFITFYYHL